MSKGGGGGTVWRRGKGRRSMIYVHSLVWEVSNVESTCELTGSGESEPIHRDESEQPEINMTIWVPRTRPVLGKMAGIRGYQTIESCGTLFFSLNSKLRFLEACTNGE